MADTDIVQVIAEARIDARSLSEFVFKPAGFMVTRRLAPSINTLEYYLNHFRDVEARANTAINNIIIDGNAQISNAISNAGFVQVGTFAAGATLAQRNDAIQASDGKLYRWGGSLPKTVAASSTPENSGGFGSNAWLEVSDAALRQQLAGSTANGLGAALVRGAVIHVSSIATMKSHSLPVGSVFSLNDGERSGTFDVISGNFTAEVAADISGGVFVTQADDPTGSNKIAKRRVVDSITPEMFGVVAGSYVSGNTGRFQAAIDVSQLLGVSLFLKGKYENKPLKCDSGFSLIGLGRGVSTLKLNDGYDLRNDPVYKSVLTNRNTLPSDVGGSGDRDSGIRIKGVCFDGNRDNVTDMNSESECLSFYGVEDVIVEDCSFINGSADGFDIDYSKNVHLSDFYAANCVKSGIHLSVGSPQGVNQGNIGCSVRNGLIEDIDGSGFTDDIYNNVGGENLFENIIVKRCGQEVGKFGAFHVASPNSVVNNITVEDCSANGFGIGYTSRGVGGIRADNIVVRNCGEHGVRVHGNNCTLSNVVIMNYGKSGGSSAAYGITVFSLEDAAGGVITGLKLLGITVSSELSGSHAIRTAHLDRATIKDIKISNITGRGLSLVGNITNSYISDVIVDTSSAEGFYVTGLDNTYISNISLTDCGASSVSAYACPENSLYEFKNTILSGLIVKFTGATTKPAYALSTSTSNLKIMNYILSNSILHSGSTGHTDIASNVSESNIIRVGL